MSTLLEPICRGLAYGLVQSPDGGINERKSETGIGLHFSANSCGGFVNMCPASFGENNSYIVYTLVNSPAYEKARTEGLNRYKNMANSNSKKQLAKMKF